MFDIIERQSGALMDNQNFRNAPLATQNRIWKKIVSEAKKSSKAFISMQFNDADDVVAQLYNIADKHSRNKIDEAREELELEKDLDQMSRAELIVLQDYLDIKDSLDKLKDNQIMRGKNTQ